MARRVVYVTGGMSGIGHYLAGQYASAGCDIALFDLVQSEERRQEVEQRRAGTDQQVRAYRADVTDAAGLKAAVDQAVRDVGAPDLAINSAGIQRAKEFLKQSPEEFELVVRVNLLGSRHFAAAVLPRMKRGGHLAFIASLAGLTSSYAYAAYCSSKFGVLGLANVLRIEMKPKGIDISVICPPEVSTPMVEVELRTMHPVTRELKDFAGVLTLPEACDEILARLEKRQFRIIPGSKARLTYRLARFLPDFVLNTVVDRKAARILAAHPDQ
jgi:NAD(P)-dependent dehydrogenase (short-subunit alcohol dehydrogenase family)